MNESIRASARGGWSDKQRRRIGKAKLKTNEVVQHSSSSPLWFTRFNHNNLVMTRNRIRSPKGSIYSPFEVNQGLIAGWFWKSGGYWWRLSLSRSCCCCCWWLVAVVMFWSRDSFSFIALWWTFFLAIFSCSTDGEFRVMVGLDSDSSLFVFSFADDSTSSSQLFSFRCSFCTISIFFVFFDSLFSSRMSLMWKPEVALVDLGNFMLSRNLWIRDKKIIILLRNSPFKCKCQAKGSKKKPSLSEEFPLEEAENFQCGMKRDLTKAIFGVGNEVGTVIKFSRELEMNFIAPWSSTEIFRNSDFRTSTICYTQIFRTMNTLNP